ncbi:Hypothetical predicted protein [Octopus vulgaris]|uniref:Protein unc-93 homolog A n=1 Tax=Octopus vulgaris TaxID=6645 RepID=A0AA36AFS9_OCTVU|nr:Hypothetical predicted protein [Octopus vulgaris]
MDLKKNFDCFIFPANMELNNQTHKHKSYPCEHEMQLKGETTSTSDNLFHEDVNSVNHICKENNVIEDVDNTLITGVSLESDSNGFAPQDGIIIDLKDKTNSPQVEPGGVDILAIENFDSMLTAEKTKAMDIYYEEENLNYCVDSDVPLLSSSVESDMSVEVLNPLDICNVYSERNQSDSDVSLLSMSGDEVSNGEPEEYNNYELAHTTASDHCNILPNVTENKSDNYITPLNLNNPSTDTFLSYENKLNDSKELFIIPEAKQLQEAFMDQTESINSRVKYYTKFIDNPELASSQSTNEIKNFTEKTFLHQNGDAPGGEIINQCDQKMAELSMMNNSLLTHSTSNNINDTATTWHFYDKDSSLVECSQDCSLMKNFDPHSPSVMDSNTPEISAEFSQTCLEASQLNGNEKQQYGEAIQEVVALEKQDSCDSTLPLIDSEIISIDSLYSKNFSNSNISEIEPTFSKEKNVPLLHFLGSSNLISTSHCSSQEHVNLSDACIHMLNNLNNSYSNISLMHISSLKNIQETYEDNISVISSETVKTTNHWKNLIAYSIGFMVMYMAFGSLRHLQSSINNSNGVGLITLSCLFAFFVIGSLFASYVVKELEPRRATLVTVLFHILYVISNCYPSIYILMPASAMLGFWNAVSWGAQGIYIQRLACDYAIKKGKKTEHICSKFHGVFYLILFFSEVFGNLISSLILSSSETGSSLNEQNQTDFYYKNSTLEAITNITHKNQQCGINYNHLKHEDEKSIPISQNIIFLLTAIFTGLDILAFAIIFFFVDPLTSNYRNSLPQTARNCEKLWRDIKSVLIFTKDWRFVLLIPIYLFSAMHLAYISAEITKAFATCMLGVHMVGYLMICYGISDALSSYISGWLNQITGRILLITIGSLSFQLVILSLFLWQPVSTSLLPYILIFGFWGLSDGFYASQLCSEFRHNPYLNPNSDIEDVYEPEEDNRKSRL